jgi:hypothetical protein
LLTRVQYDEGATRADLLALDEPRRGGLFSPARVRDRGNVFALGTRGALLQDIRADPLAPPRSVPTVTIADLRKTESTRGPGGKAPAAAAAPVQSSPLSTRPLRRAEAAPAAVAPAAGSATVAVAGKDARKDQKFPFEALFKSFHVRACAILRSPESFLDA